MFISTTVSARLPPARCVCSVKAGITHLRGAGGRLPPPFFNCIPVARPKELYQPQLHFQPGSSPGHHQRRPC